MIIDLESADMAWRFYLNIKWTCFYIAVVIAGIDIEFHIINLRDVIYQSSASKVIEGEK